MSDPMAAVARPARKLAQVISRIGKARPQPTGFRIPILAGVPDPDVCNFWMAYNGNLFGIRDDGVTMSWTVRTGYTANGVQPPNEPDLVTYRQTARRGGDAAVDGSTHDVTTFCPTHGLEQGGFYGYTPGHGNRVLLFAVYFGPAVNAGGGGPVVPGSGVPRSATIKFRNVTTFSGGPVLLHFGMVQPYAVNSWTPASFIPTWRDVLVDTWPAQGCGGDLDGEHDFPIGVLSNLNGTPTTGDYFMISQPDNDLVSAGQLDPESIEVSMTWTDRVYP